METEVQDLNLIFEEVNVESEVNSEAKTPLSVNPSQSAIDSIKNSTKRILKNAHEKEPNVVFNGKLLKFNVGAYEMIGAKPGDKIFVGFRTFKDYPVVFVDEDGNKLGEDGNVAYGGAKGKILLELGTEFKVEAQDEFFVLVPLK